MKFLFILIGLTSLVLHSQDLERKVKIKSIDSTSNHYFFKGVFKDKSKNKLIIISKRDTTVTGCSKITVNKKYLLKLNNYFSDEYINSLPVIPDNNLKIRDLDYIIWDGTTDFPYTSPNIKSLYYIKD